MTITGCIFIGHGICIQGVDLQWFDGVPLLEVIQNIIIQVHGVKAAVRSSSKTSELAN